jgi:energy-converting hydrogenase Eha subunit C
MDMIENKEEFLWAKNRKEKILFTGILFFILFFVLVGIGIVGAALEMPNKFYLSIFGISFMMFGIGTCMLLWGVLVKEEDKKEKW